MPVRLSGFFASSAALTLVAATILAPVHSAFAHPAGAASVTAALEPAPDLAPAARAAVLMDAMTGTVLYQKNAHARLPIASVTKIPTMLLIFDSIARGQVHWSDLVRTSEHAAGMGGSQIFLEPGERMTLQDIVKGIAIGSGNDAAVAAAEHIAGSESDFVRRMNGRAAALGLRDSHFANTNGLPAPNHYSSAFDIAVLSRELLRHDSVVKFTGVYSDYLRKGSARPFWLVNTNKLVRFYPGMDGLKTGFTAEAKYCLSATAKRGHFRAIAVVLGAPSSRIRNAEIAEMLNYAFTHYDMKLVYGKGQVVALAPVNRGRLEAVGAATAAPVGLLVSRMNGAQAGRVVAELHPVKAPVRKGQIAGHVRVLEGNRTLLEVPLVAIANVPQISWPEMLGRTLKRVFVLGATR